MSTLPSKPHMGPLPKVSVPPALESMKSQFVDSEVLLSNENPMMMGGKKSKKSKSTKPAASKPKKSKKKGGALMDDVKNLAVPFAILLAKQGLQSVFDKKKKSPKSAISAKSAEGPSSPRRKATATGGSCGSGCSAQPMAGGAKKSKKVKSKKTTKKGGELSDVQSRFDKLSQEIDSFLKKY